MQKQFRIVCLFRGSWCGEMERCYGRECADNLCTYYNNTYHVDDPDYEYIVEPVC